MASFGPPPNRAIPPPGLMRGQVPPNRGQAPPPRPGAISPYNRMPQQQGMTSQRSLTPELLSAMARRRLGG